MSILTLQQGGKTHVSKNTAVSECAVNETKNVFL